MHYIQAELIAEELAEESGIICADYIDADRDLLLARCNNVID